MQGLLAPGACSLFRGCRTSKACRATHLPKLLTRYCHRRVCMRSAGCGAEPARSPVLHHQLRRCSRLPAIARRQIRACFGGVLTVAWLNAALFQAKRPHTRSPSTWRRLSGVSCTISTTTLLWWRHTRGQPWSKVGTRAKSSHAVLTVTRLLSQRQACKLTNITAYFMAEAKWIFSLKNGKISTFRTRASEKQRYIVGELNGKAN